MRLIPNSLVALLLWVFPNGAGAQSRPADPWPGPKGESIFLEAEDFPNDGKGWQVIDTPHSIFAQVASGLKALHGVADQASVRKEIHVPGAGAFRLWVRFTHSPEAGVKKRGPFRVAIEQGGQVAAEHVFDEQPLAKKVSGRAAYLPYEWEFFAAPLKRGPATITLTAMGRALDPQVRRVDCLLLTSDTAYQPDDRDFAPQTYLRIRLKHSAPDKVYFYTFADHLRQPWYQNLYFARKGWHDGVSAAKADYLGAGEATPWTNISRLLYGDCDTMLSMQATAAYHHPDAAESDYELDFATTPAESGIVKVLRRSGPGAGMQMRVPPDLTNGRAPKADYEYAAERAAFVAKLQPPHFGKVPEKFPLLIGLGASDMHNSPSVRTDELRVLRFMGLNGRQAELDDADLRDGLRFGSAGASIWHMGPARYNEPLLDKLTASVKQGAAELAESPHPERAVQTLMMDEACAKDLKAMVGTEADERRFGEWLRQKGETPASLGVSSWDKIHLTADRDSQPPSLYYLSQRFRAWSVAEFFRLATEQVRLHYPAGAPATQNFSDGAVYVANFYSQGNDYFTWFNHGALDAALSEDWTNGGATFEDCGWNVALLRAATRKHRQPIHMYVITSYGRRPLDVKLKVLTDISEGAKMLSFFSYTPQYAGHEPGWAENYAMFPAVAEVTREIGAAEDVLLDAMPRRAETAILYSTAYDIWNVNLDNTQGHERMHTWLALRHAQVPVDVISDEDAREGELQGRKVIYLHGEQLDARNIAPLAAWVHAGGTLVLGPEAGSRDELNRPSDALDRALGISRQLGKTLQRVWHSGSYVCQLLKPQGKVHVGAETVDLLARSQPIEAGVGAEVLAKFDDGKPAAVRQVAGKGHIVQWGFLPALAYMRGAYLNYQAVRDSAKIAPFPAAARAMALLGEKGDASDATGTLVSLASYSAAPIHYSAALRDLISSPARAAKVSRPVELSTPQVEASYLEGAHGWVIPLANYTGAPLKHLTLTVRPGRAFGAVHSSRGGVLPQTTHPDGSATVMLPLESTDFVFAEWQP